MIINVIEFFNQLQVSGQLHMWFTLVLIVCAMAAYSSEKVSMEVTSAIVFSFLLLFFHFFPLMDDYGNFKVNTTSLLAGFANPALIAIICLLIVGQSVVQTGAINEIANIIIKISRNNAFISIILSLIFVMVISAVLNNTPVVVIFIPVIASLAKNYNVSVSKTMIPLSYAAILGGMMTLIGSSTNLLVSGTLVEMGYSPLTFFEFTIPGMVMASVGLVYVIFIAPKLLPDRASMSKSMVGEDERQFIAQLEIDRSSKLLGAVLNNDKLPEFKDVSIRMIQRGEHAFLPPFDKDFKIKLRDIIVISATRDDVTKLVSKQPDMLLKSNVKTDDENDNTNNEISIAEVIVTPTSRMIGRNLEQLAFYNRHKCVVLGIQRQSRIIRARISEIRLSAGDVLLLIGNSNDILSLQESKDMMLLELSTKEVHSGKKAKQAAIVLTSVVGLAALDIVPIAISAFAGATALILTGCLNVRQARRSIDGQVVMIVSASLALGAALQQTGGADFIAQALVSTLEGSSALVIMSVLFFAMAIITNLLSNNASAVLFTPIAIRSAEQLGMETDMFVFAVIFACNCSFITPIGYQTNLLVMGPGHYKFSDFMRSGVPLTIIMWATYTIFSSFYFV